MVFGLHFRRQRSAPGSPSGSSSAGSPSSSPKLPSREAGKVAGPSTPVMADAKVCRPIAVTTGPTVLRSVIPKRAKLTYTSPSPGASPVCAQAAPPSPSPSHEEVEFVLSEDLIFERPASEFGDDENAPVACGASIHEADSSELAFGLEDPSDYKDQFRPPPCPRLSYHSVMDTPSYVASSSWSASRLYSPFAAGYSLGVAPASVRSSYFEYTEADTVEVLASSCDSTASCFQGSGASFNPSYWKDLSHRPSFSSILSSASESPSMGRDRSDSLVETPSTISSCEVTGAWPFEQRRRSHAAERRGYFDRRASYERRISLTSALGRVSCR